ncbi:sensor histidine kinase [Limisalsivibrio acetivorans]|uniref:sensor histidine kinase n=1 Tax=Limisalsivibrio acetivorans TaxID=1304888 RepID=UPI0003B764E3|nr:ATP-binding protein [Limisalsivibrio acetivorans]
MTGKGRYTIRRILMYSLLVAALLVVNLLVGSNIVNTGFPWYSNISIFLLINTNIILLLVVFILIFRNLGKLLVDRKRNIFGTRLQSKLVIFSVILAVIPVFIVFAFSSTVINNSIDKWFDAQIEQALKSSIDLMQKYQNRLEQDIIEQSDILSQLITSRGFMFSNKKEELQEFIKDYIERNQIDGIAVYNNQKVKLSSEEKGSFFFFSFLNDDVVEEILSKKQVARYEFFGYDQIYWVGHPISSKTNENIVVGGLFLYRKVPSNEAEKVSKILDSYNNYSQVKFFAEPVKNSYKILLILMTLLVVFAGIWGSLIFSRGITEPLEKLAEASLDVSRGNLDVNLESVGDDEIGFLTKSFNDMVKRLKEHNEELNLKNEKLAEMFMQIARDNQYIDTIFKNVKSAIVLYDGNMNPLKSNDLAQMVIEQNPIEFEQKVAVRMEEFFRSNKHIYHYQTELLLNGEIRTFTANITKLYGQDGSVENIVMVLDDITDIVHYQRMTIWKEIATRIAHEIKNPLTPIKLTAERVKKRLGTSLSENSDKELVNSSMETIITEVNELQNMVNEFNMFARLPELAKDSFDLCGFFDEILQFYEQSHTHISFEIDCAPPSKVNADRNQLKRVFFNLMNNAIQAIEGEGSITITSAEQGGMYRITFTDSGKGIPSEDISKIFVPYFSKKPDGTGLGLAIVRKIIEEHNGRITAESKEGEYTRFIIELPKGA